MADLPAGNTGNTLESFPCRGTTIPYFGTVPCIGTSSLSLPFPFTYSVASIGSLSFLGVPSSLRFFGTRTIGRAERGIHLEGPFRYLTLTFNSLFQ
jgi:hypothetical protein